MSDCIFCKIVKGEIPNYTVYENDKVLAFLDIHPHAKGHTVVVPKKHFSNLSELNESDWSDLLLGVRATRLRLEEVLKPEGFNIAINDSEVAGQVVPHVHWHIFPRYAHDGGASAHAIVRNAGDTPVSEIAKLF